MFGKPRTTGNYLVIEEYLERGEKLPKFLHHPARGLSDIDKERFMAYCQQMTKDKVDAILASNSKDEFVKAFDDAIMELNPLETPVIGDRGTAIRCVVPTQNGTLTFYRNVIPHEQSANKAA